MKDLLFQVESRAFRRFYHATGFRPASARYISGDGFRRLSQHQFEGSDGRKTFKPGSVRAGDCVFCEAGLLPEFFTDVCPAIPVSFRLVSHNGDATVGADLADRVPGNVTRWFAQNVAVRHPRIDPIPIGLENRRLHTNGVVHDYDRLRRRLTGRHKVSRVLHGFTVGTNPAEREPCLRALQACRAADQSERMGSRQYRRQLAGYQFVASPPGNGEDCHRTWEALYLKVIPIVKRTPLTEHFAGLGLPLMLVDRWKDLAAIDEEHLQHVYRTLSPRFDHPALWMSFWSSRISDRSGQ